MDDPKQQLSLWDMRNQQGFEGFLDETERHLHNYVAAAQSRVEHFRQFVRNEWVEDSTFRRAYQERVAKEFAVSLLHNFITDLRNFMLHARLPVSAGTLSWTAGGPMTYQAVLDTT